MTPNSPPLDVDAIALEVRPVAPGAGYALIPKPAHDGRVLVDDHELSHHSVVRQGVAILGSTVVGK